MNATLAPVTTIGTPLDTTSRERYRGTAKSLRSNAGIDSADRIEAVADFGAAARRLRESVRAGEDGPSARRHVSASRRAQSQADVSSPAAQDDIVVIADEPVALDSSSRANARKSFVLRKLREHSGR